MKKVFSLKLFIALLCLFYSSIAHAESLETSKADKSLFETKCSYCHEIERPLSKRKNKDGWTATVKRMQSKNPSHISDAEAESIIAYLSYERGEEAPVNRIKDPSNLSELEKKHVPVIQIGSGDVEKKIVTITVKVGEVPHPMEATHYIKYIELFIDGKSAGKVDLKPGDKPEASFNVSGAAGKRVTAREECNLHGLWEGEAR
ncbi:MAG: desulfoferrodoxin family protein [bacterium]|nr:desulfoferrodoxin family protein [bacterium]